MRCRTVVIIMLASTIMAIFNRGETFSEFHALETKQYLVATDEKMYPTWSIMAKLFNQNLHNPKRTKVALKITSSQEESLHLVQSGKADFFGSDGQLCCKAVSGEEPFSHKSDNIKVIGWMHSMPLQIVAPANSDIESFMDLRGKRIAISAEDSRTAESFRTICEMAGLTNKDFEFIYLGKSESVAAMKERRVDALAIQESYPTPAVMKLSESVPIKLIPIRIGLAQKLYRKCPHHVLSIFPANIYKGQTKTILVVDSPWVWGAAASIPDEFVYTLIKLIKENIDELAKVDILFRQWKFRPSCRKVGFLHPGAVKFYEELEPGCYFRIIFM